MGTNELLRFFEAKVWKHGKNGGLNDEAGVSALSFLVQSRRWGELGGTIADVISPFRRASSKSTTLSSVISHKRRTSTHRLPSTGLRLERLRLPGRYPIDPILK
jgi:hypothetical protein